MKEVKRQGNKFVDIQNDRTLLCAFSLKDQCTTECTACEINSEGLQHIVTCLRGSFQFGGIKEPAFDQFG